MLVLFVFVIGIACGVAGAFLGLGFLFRRVEQKETRKLDVTFSRNIVARRSLRAAIRKNHEIPPDFDLNTTLEDRELDSEVAGEQDVDFYAELFDPIECAPSENNLEGTVTIQPEGKRKKRLPYQCSVHGNLFSIRSLEKDPLKLAVEFVLNDCVIRPVRLDQRGSYCIFIRNPQQPLYYGVFYLYLVFKSDTERNRWYQCLLSRCKTTGPPDDLVQAVDAYREAQGKSSEAVAIKEKEKRFRHQMRQKLKDRTRTSNSPAQSVYTQSTQTQAVASLNTIGKPPPSVDWLNVILHRFFASMEPSELFLHWVETKLMTKMLLKLTEKNPARFGLIISDIQVKNVSFNSALPKFLSAELIPPPVPGSVLVAFPLCYNGGLLIEVSGLLKFTAFPVSSVVDITLRLQSFEGKLMLFCEPVPANTFAITFYKHPVMKWDIDICLRDAKNEPVHHVDVVRKYLRKKIEVAFAERLVLPNRKFFQIPKTHAKPEPTGAMRDALAAAEAAPSFLSRSAASAPMPSSRPATSAAASSASGGSSSHSSPSASAPASSSSVADTTAASSETPSFTATTKFKKHTLTKAKDSVRKRLSVHKGKSL
eukprot:CAMPEP_0174240738 /NCGR_PEP_ID=MMETSP0417-20130205/20267_1 /TAXON_ID=242541 /ORGANISM="Mayorella sp, Strain BSH-02190019" /LENGTH=593 /DNA_ID=CAMNT_0015319873 /DNA_START=61 /DNA_END=1842 /DNA_ORIENTATION=-